MFTYDVNNENEPERTLPVASFTGPSPVNLLCSLLAELPAVRSEDISRVGRNLCINFTWDDYTLF